MNTLNHKTPRKVDKLNVSIPNISNTILNGRLIDGLIIHPLLEYKPKQIPTNKLTLEPRKYIFNSEFKLAYFVPSISKIYLENVKVNNCMNKHKKEKVSIIFKKPINNVLRWRANLANRGTSNILATAEKIVIIIPNLLKAPTLAIELEAPKIDKK